MTTSLLRLLRSLWQATTPASITDARYDLLEARHTTATILLNLHNSGRARLDDPELHRLIAELTELRPVVQAERARRRGSSAPSTSRSSDAAQR